MSHSHASAASELGAGPSFHSSPLPRTAQLESVDGKHFDVVIIGSGAGGGTLARHLASTGLRLLVLERGDWLPQEPQNWDAAEVFQKGRYLSKDTWYDRYGKAFQPGSHYFVGGATKMYGAAHFRLRQQTLRSWCILMGSLRPGHCAIPISSPGISGLKRCITCMVSVAKIPPSPRAAVPTPIRRLPMSLGFSRWSMTCDRRVCIPSMHPAG